MTALTPSSDVPLAAQFLEDPEPYSLPPRTTSGMSSVRVGHRGVKDCLRSIRQEVLAYPPSTPRSWLRRRMLANVPRTMTSGCRARSMLELKSRRSTPCSARWRPRGESGLIAPAEKCDRLHQIAQFGQNALRDVANWCQALVPTHRRMAPCARRLNPPPNRCSP